jgi:hypothetical protein
VLDPIVYWMPAVARDIGRCFDFARRQPHANPDDRRSEIKRGIARICADPGGNRPELKLVESGWWLRRSRLQHTLIVYAYLSPTAHRSRGVIILVAVRHMRVASMTIEPEAAITKFWPEPDHPEDGGDPETWDCILDEEDDIDWDDITAAIENDEDAGELAFNSADYATEEEAMIALRAFIHEIFDEVESNVASDPALDAPGQNGHQKESRFYSTSSLGKAEGS